MDFIPILFQYIFLKNASSVPKLKICLNIPAYTYVLRLQFCFGVNGLLNGRFVLLCCIMSTFPLLILWEIPKGYKVTLLF